MSAARKSLPANWFGSRSTVQHAHEYTDSAATYLIQGSPRIGNDTALHRMSFSSVQEVRPNCKFVRERELRERSGILHGRLLLGGRSETDYAIE
jgi:hypothetical protein